MVFPIDRRTAFGGLAALTYGLGAGERTHASPGAGIADGGQASAPSSNLHDRPSVRDKGAKGDGKTMDGAAIQDALRAFDTIWVPPGVYMIDVPLTIPSYCVLAFSSDAIFCPAADGMTIFRTDEASYASRILAPRIHGRGKRDITAFDLRGFRHRAEIQHADIYQCARGIVLRELCWDTILYMPWIRETTHPVVIANGSNAVDVIHPGIDGFDTGIAIEMGPQHSTTSVRIFGGYVQNGRYGIVDRGGLGTIVDGTYFEGMSDADIQLSHALRTNLSRTQHYGDKGKVAIQAIGVDGLTVFDPLMPNGVRSIGLYDIDAPSRNVTRFETGTGGGLNRPLGNVAGTATFVREEAGSFVPELAGASPRYTRAQGRWRRAGAQVMVSVDLVWTNAAAGEELVVRGLPSILRSAQPLHAALAPAVVGGESAGQALARLTPDGTVRIVTLDRAGERPWPRPTRGSLEVSLSFLV